MGFMRLGIVTCRPLPEPDVDEELTLTAFPERGVAAEMVDWRSQSGAGFDALLIRSTWDYHLAPNAFREWVRNAPAPLWNPAEVVIWNMDKRYLAEVAKNLPIVPTVFGDTPRSEWSRFVVKPTVSCGSYQTMVFDHPDDAAELIAEIQKGSEPMIQPYMKSVDGEGERSIMWIGGEVTHAIRKEPRFLDSEESVSAAYAPSPEEVDFARRAVDLAPGEIVYARVDVMRGDDGQLCLSELELIEPSLFLTQNPAAAGKLVDAVLSKMK